ncbi:MAG: DNA-binding NtrC family response regulator [Myxococcota bacterium]|jgi:DNA-binding NtrC family response regulator
MTAIPIVLPERRLAATSAAASLPLPRRAEPVLPSTISERLSPKATPGPKPRPFRYGDLVCRSRLMRQCLLSVRQAATTDLPVLISGESGVGKELVARAIHRQGRRGHEALVPLNCAALPPELAESELFGHVRGAFTGAVHAADGAFASANLGTLFLDEIGELPPSLQPKLLRVLETGEVRAVGASRSRPVDTRLIAASNRDLRHEASMGRFRSDLMYRLDVLHIVVPPLRRRLEDLDVLVPHLLARDGYRLAVTPAGMLALRDHNWPGNVRELRNVLLRAAHRCQSNITGRDVRRSIRGRVTPAAPLALRESAFEAASRALRANGGNRRATYEALGVPKSTFYRWLRHGHVNDRASSVEA